MDMKRYIAILVCLVCLSYVNVYAQTNEKQVLGDAFLFTFAYGEGDIQASYGGNGIEIERLNRKIWPVMNQLTEGSYHILIVSHIASETGAISKTSINSATWRADRVRRYLRNKYELSGTDMSYYIDRSGKWGNSVHVYLLYFPMPDFANCDLYFSLEQTPEDINLKFQEYGDELPYIYVMNDPDLSTSHEPFAYVVVNNKADLPYEDGADLGATLNPVVRPVEKEAYTYETRPIEVEAPVEEDALPVVAEKATEPKPAVKSKETVVSKGPVAKRRYPVFHPVNLIVKTNLLPWATLSPGLSVGVNGAEMSRGSFMPNLELEYAYAGWGSVVVGGTYSRFKYGGDPNNLWGVSAVMVEPRLWFNDDGTYRGFNFGLQFKYGNFNIRDNEPFGYGKTGQFFNAAAMLNYVQPIWDNFAVEAGVGLGARMVFDAAEYQRDYEQQVSQTMKTFSETTFLVNLRLALVYRFGFY